jgi:hypothetical protein
MPRRYVVETYWSVLESASREIEAKSADDALRELFELASNDSSFFEASVTSSDSAGPSTFEVWSKDRRRLLRFVPSSDELRATLYPELVAAMRVALPLLPSGSRRKYARLLRQAEAALR